ncbi:hypothetical protein SAMN04488542_1464 [Fontibacillus panacisegetis]|uniref:Uncharacterized protein n=1 Tax=Fontibacillus panacisegetis TaxID=670482 RepID=A0A1G7UIT4_9BACL|nr:DUF6483 family protein [Fontibacillus panacisegetis]SDG47456.1 hypothetical protein SAMN04488542_1464 [Fontibacillus panacisegetis]
MLRRDYLVRMIEEMAEVIGKVFDLKQQRKTVEALWTLDELFQRQFRFNSALLGSLSAKDIVDLFRNGELIEADKLQSLARLLKEEGDVYLLSGQSDEGTVRHMKALHLYLVAGLNGGDTTLWNLDGEIKELLCLLKGYRLYSETEQLLLRYEEAAGRFDLAENALFRLLKNGEATKEEGIAFYERLLSLNPHELERGGLPVEEVKEGLDEVHRDYA